MIGQAKPDEQIEVTVGKSRTTSVRAYGGEVEALTVADMAGVGVRVIVGGRQGFASAGSIDDDVVAEVLREARDNVSVVAPDPHVVLATDDGVEPAAVDVWDEGVDAMPVADKVEMAIELERRVLADDPRISGVRTAAYADGAGVSVIASTAGIRAASRGTSASLGVLALATAGAETQTGSGSSVARGPADLDIDEAASDAIERATVLLGAVKPPSAKVTLVLEPRLAASILGIVGAMLSGERVLKGRTPFADRVGEPIAALNFSMDDDPTNPASYGARTYDGEGLATRINPLIVDGVLQRFLYDTASASKAGVAGTGSAVRGLRSTPGVGWQALAIAPGVGAVDELIEQVGEGLFLQTMAGLHSGVNPVSGDFSVGAQGLMIRDGQLAEPVREVTIASTLPKLLTDIVAIGAEVEHLPGGVSAPAMAFANVAMSGS